MQPPCSLRINEFTQALLALVCDRKQRSSSRQRSDEDQEQRTILGSVTTSVARILLFPFHILSKLFGNVIKEDPLGDTAAFLLLILLHQGRYIPRRAAVARHNLFKTALSQFFDSEEFGDLYLEDTSAVNGEAF